MIRTMHYPNFTAEASEDGVRLEFVAPGSKFGAVHILLDAVDAGTLRDLISSALDDRILGQIDARRVLRERQR